MVADTIRDRIMDGIIASIIDIKEGQPVSDPYTITFSRVRRGPIKELAKGKTSAVGILEGPERKNPSVTMLQDAILEMVVEIHLKIGRNKNASKEINRVMGDVQRKLAEDTSVGSLALDVTETGNEIDIDTLFDRTVTAALFFDVKYRTAITDPRSAT